MGVIGDLGWGGVRCLILVVLRDNGREELEILSK